MLPFCTKRVASFWYFAWLRPVSSFTTIYLASTHLSTVLLTMSTASGTETTSIDSSAQHNSRKGLHIRFPQDCLSEDHYGGVTLRLDHLFSTDCDHANNECTASDILDHFEELFKAQIERWQTEKKKGIWVHVPIEASELVPILAKEMFSFHMVTGSTLVMTRWLPVHTESRLPRGPTHQVGVGCLVYKPNDRSKILVVQEKSGPAAAYNLWKMPTGLSGPDEDIHEAAIRELMEETGLNSTFDGLACLRQAPIPKAVEIMDQKFANSRKAADLFFICCLSIVDGPASGNNDEDWEACFKPCPDEIAGIKWMKISDFSNQGLWQNSPLYQQLNAVLFEGQQDSFWKDSKMHIRQGQPAKNTLYHPSSLLTSPTSPPDTC
jgi:8-oxo-dGTP pyrophosphatase MutT (NUDIX family)